MPSTGPTSRASPGAGSRGPITIPTPRGAIAKGGGPGEKDDRFFGYYLQIATMIADEEGVKVPELARRMALTSCHVDPPPAFVGVLEAMAASGVTLGDVVVDAGYAHRVPEHWALPLRRLGAELVMDLHPHDRAPRALSAGRCATTGTSTARPPRLRCSHSSRWPGGPTAPRRRPRRNVKVRRLQR